MTIQFSDLKAQYNESKLQIDNAIQQVLNDGNYILGKQVFDLEERFSKYSGYEYGVGVSSGTAAIELLLRTIPKSKDSEIIIPANTFIASVIAAMAAGYKVRLADVDMDTMLMTKESVWNALGLKTDIVMGVNLFGSVVDVSIPVLCHINHMHFIYDACQSHGMNQQPYPACYSFYPAKNLGGICDGGMILTNDEEQYKHLLKLRNYGSEKKYVHDIEGQNARLDTINAAVLLQKLPKLWEWNQLRNRVAVIYNNKLQGIGDIKIRETTSSNYHLYVIRTEYRNQLQAYLKEADIPTQIHYPTPVHKNLCYKDYDFGSNNSFPNAEKLADTVLSLPIHPYMTLSELDYICDTIKSFFNGK